MTEFEIIEASATYNGLMQGWIAAYFAAFTAYCIVAYLVGKKLSTRQVLFISACYFVSSSLCILGCYGSGMLLTEFAEAARAINPDRPFVARVPVIVVSILIFYASLLGSLRFMWDIRHPKTE